MTEMVVKINTFPIRCIGVLTDKKTSVVKECFNLLPFETDIMPKPQEIAKYILNKYLKDKDIANIVIFCLNKFYAEEVKKELLKIINIKIDI